MSRSNSIDAIAIVGIGCLYPNARNKKVFWQQTMKGQSHFSPLPTGRFWQTDEAVKDYLKTWYGTFFDSLQFNYKRFGIPPIFRKSVSQMSLMMLQVVDECLVDAGYEDKQALRDDVDVICGTCLGFDSTLNNAMKVEGVHLAYELAKQTANKEAVLDSMREVLGEKFGISSHDRVGEMASSIPARIASFFSFRGSVQTIESVDATGYMALETAALTLAEGKSRAVVVATGQRIENMLIPLSLQKKGFSGMADGHPFASDSVGVPLAEGATALLLKRLSDAENDNDRIYSVIEGFSGVRKDTVGGLRYVEDVGAKSLAMKQACQQADIQAKQQHYVECVLPGIGGEAQATLEALTYACNTSLDSPLHLGSSVSCHGYTFANAALTAVASVSLSLHHKFFPPVVCKNKELLPLDDGITYCKGVNWQEEIPAECFVGICGSSLNGISWHLVMRAIQTEPVKSITSVVPLSTVRQNKKTEPQPQQQEPIAIVGIGGAFGSSRDSEMFWQDLLARRDMVQKIPEEILPRAVFFREGNTGSLTTYAQYGSDLKDRMFDVSAYKIFPKRAASMDITQKLTLRVAEEALRDYGLDDKRENLQKAGIFVATNLSLNQERKLACRVHARELFSTLGKVDPLINEEALLFSYTMDLEEIDQFTMDGYLASGIASLISSSFGLNAMPMAVEAACASSLAAIKNGVQALRRGRYDFVIAGGVELPVNARDFLLCSTQIMLSQDKISPFAEGADGFSPGDGAGIFVLKRLQDAQRDGDKIYAVISGISGSCDATSMTAPDAEGQILAIKRAYQQVSYSPLSVQYVEAHGTGTRLGDISELTAIATVYGGSKRTFPLKIGSVKSNIGHTFSAAGSAGLLKTVLAMKHKILPATLVRRKVNPELALARIPAEIVDKAQDWIALDGRRRAAVSSFGTGGINYHLILEAFEEGVLPELSTLQDLSKYQKIFGSN